MDELTKEIILILIDKLAIGVLIILIAYYFNRLLERHKVKEKYRMEYEALRDKTYINHLQRQIGELYAPLLGLIQYGNSVNEVEFIKTSKEGVDTVEIKRYFVEKYYLALNTEISDLIRVKYFLLATDNAPESFLKFLSHAARLECLHNLYKDKKIDSCEIDNPYPDKFKQEVQETLNKLKNEHEAFISNLKQPSKIR